MSGCLLDLLVPRVRDAALRIISKVCVCVQLFACTLMRDYLKGLYFVCMFVCCVPAHVCLCGMFFCRPTSPRGSQWRGSRASSRSKTWMSALNGWKRKDLHCRRTKPILFSNSVRERERARRKKVIMTRDRIGKSDVRCGGGGCVIVIGDEENKKLATKKCSYNIGDICSLLWSNCACVRQLSVCDMVWVDFEDASGSFYLCFIFSFLFRLPISSSMLFFSSVRLLVSFFFFSSSSSILVFFSIIVSFLCLCSLCVSTSVYLITALKRSALLKCLTPILSSCHPIIHP